MASRQAHPAICSPISAERASLEPSGYQTIGCDAAATKDGDIHAHALAPNDDSPNPDTGTPWHPIAPARIPEVYLRQSLPPPNDNLRSCSIWLGRNVLMHAPGGRFPPYLPQSTLRPVRLYKRARSD
jgi:hypothetical protein